MMTIYELMPTWALFGGYLKMEDAGRSKYDGHDGQHDILIPEYLLNSALRQSLP